MPLCPGLWLMLLPLPALAAFKPLLLAQFFKVPAWFLTLASCSISAPAFQEGLPWVSHSTAKAGQQARVPAITPAEEVELEPPARSCAQPNCRAR